MIGVTEMGTKYIQAWKAMFNTVLVPPSLHSYFPSLSGQPARVYSHRTSCCDFQEYVFMMVPRDCPGDSGGVTPDMYYLDLQYFKIPVSDNRAERDGFFLDHPDAEFPNDAYRNGYTFQASTTAARHQGINRRYLTAMVSGSMGAAYGFWIEANPLAVAISDPLRINVLQITSFEEGTPASSIDENRSFELAGRPGGKEVKDFAVTAYGSYAVLFFSFWGDSHLYYSLFDGGTFSAITPISNYNSGGQFQSYFTLPGIIQSIDCTTIYNFLGAKTNLENVGLVVAFSNEKGLPYVTPFALEPIGVGDIPQLAPNKSVENFFVASPQYIVTPGLPKPFKAEEGCVARCCWGVLRDVDTFDVDVPTSSLLLYYGAGYTLADGAINNRAIPCSTPYIVQLDLTATVDNTKQSWDSYKPYPNVDNSFTTADMVCFLPVARNGGFALTGTEKYAPDTGGQAAIFVNNGAVYYDDNIQEPASTTMSQLPSYRLIGYPLASDLTDQESYSADMTYEQIKAASGAWILIGVITGGPPNIVETGSKALLKISNSSKQNQENSFSASTSFGVSGTVNGEGFKISGGYSHTSATKHTAANGFDSENSATTHNPPWGSGKQYPEEEHGWLYVVMPVLTRGDYGVQTWDGQNLQNLTIHAVFTGNPKKHHYKMIPFKLKNPNDPVTHSDSGMNPSLTKFVAQFDMSTLSKMTDNKLNGFPNVNDLSEETGWHYFTKIINNYERPELFVVKAVEKPNDGQLGSVVIMDSINISSDWDGESKTAFNTSNSKTQDNEATLKFSVGGDIGPLNFGANYSSSSNSSVMILAEKTFQITIDYPRVTGGEFDNFTVQPYIFFADSEDLFWIPKVFKGQKPWLLIWNVT